MDLYRYFHPHHNPRLRNTALRLQELAEIEQAAVELQKSIKRAKIRTANAPAGGIREEHLAEVLRALDYVVESLSTLNKAHPGDNNETMLAMLREREEAPGWENWARLLKQRLEILNQHETDCPDSPDSTKEEEEPLIANK